MELLITLLVFFLFAGGIYLMMRRHLFEVLLGTLLLSHGTNLLLIAMGGWGGDQQPPILLEGETLAIQNYADPLPQALILTAIVISFGVTAFLVVLISRGYDEYRDPEVGERGRDEGEP